MIKKMVHLTYYASLKEESGIAEENFETDAITARELYRDLQKRHRFRLSDNSLKVSINDVVSNWETKLQDGDRVVFIPPFGGGSVKNFPVKFC